MEKVELSSATMQVYCLEYDDKFYTLFEMIGASQRVTSPFNWMTTATRYPNADSSIGGMWISGQNNVARLSVVEINSIFKHSMGYIQTRYANNEDGHQVTDAFGDPKNGKHIMDKRNTCSDKPKLNMALAYRAPDTSTSMGMCFNDGKKSQTNNCLCGDRSNGGMSFNQCSSNYRNMVRYNSFESDNLKCSGMHHKCYNVGSHYVFGDTYGCNKGGQRDIQGHMWQFYGSNPGFPCRNYGQYGCYGSRWIG